MNGFLAYAFTNSAVGGKILCPCRKCINSFWRDASDVREHLICDGFVKGYTTWNLHGEANTSNVNHGNSDNESSEEDEISELLRDLACGLDDRGDFEDNTSIQQPSDDLRKIHKLVEANSQSCILHARIIQSFVSSLDCFISNFLEDGLIKVLTYYLIYSMTHYLGLHLYLETTMRLRN